MKVTYRATVLARDGSVHNGSIEETVQYSDRMSMAAVRSSLWRRAFGILNRNQMYDSQDCAIRLELL